MRKLATMFILSLLWAACENEPIAPEQLQEETLEEPTNDSIVEQITGEWQLEKFESKTCNVSTGLCEKISFDVNESDFFKFLGDTVVYQLFGNEGEYPLEILSQDTLIFRNHNISEYFVIKNITDNEMTLTFYMDHTDELVNDDNNITDYFYLIR